MLAAQLGITEAFGELARRYYKPLTALVGSILSRDNSVEDIVQDTLLISFRALPQLRKPNRFSPWLHSIARNQAFRYGARKKRVQLLPPEEFEKPILRFGYESSQDQQLELEKAETEKSLKVITAGLPYEFRLPVELRFWIGMPLKDIASYLSVPLSTVKWRLYRGLSLMQKILLSQDTKKGVSDGE